MLLLITNMCNAAEVVLVASDLPPLSMPDRPNRSGYAVDLAKEALRRADISYTIITMPWTRAQMETQAHDNYIIVGLGRTGHREQNYRWIGLMDTLSIVFFTDRNHPKVDDMIAAQRVPVITARMGTPFEARLRENGFGNLDLASSEEGNVKKLQTGRAQAWFTYDLRGKWLWRNLGLDPADLVMGAPITQEAVYMAAGRNFPDALAEKLRMALSSLNDDGFRQRLFKEYFGG